jgi:hypothetical protein
VPWERLSACSSRAEGGAVAGAGAGRGRPPGRWLGAAAAMEPR